MKQVSITKAVKIKNQRVKYFDGEKEYLTTGGLIGDKVKTEKVTYKNKPSRADLLVVENQLIVARMKETNKVLLIDENTNDLIVSTGFLVLDVQDGWHSGFLFHYFVSSFFQKQKDKLSIGATQKAINNEKFKEILIPEISFEDQKRIVKILDEVDALRQKRKQAIGLLDDYLKSVFLEMFGDPVKNEKGWEIIPIIKISQKITDGEHLNPKFTDEGMPMVMAGNVLQNTVDLKNAKKVDLERGKLFRKKCNPEKFDILLVSRGATIGRLCRVDTNEPFCLMGSVILIKPSTDVLNSAFLTAQLKHPAMYHKLFNSSGSSAQQAIYLKDVKKLVCILPSLSLQNEFACLVEKIEALKDTMFTQSDEIETQFQALMQKAFKGEL